MTPPELHRWFDDWLDASNRHDLAALGALLDPAVRRAGRPSGAAAWLAETAELTVAFPDHEWRRVLVVAEGDRVAAHLRFRGTHRGPWRGVAATGRHVNTAVSVFLRLTGERVAEASGGLEAAALLPLLG